MQTKIDKFGRMLLPKEIRDEFHLVPGSIIDIKKTPETILLRPVDDQSPLMVKEGVLMYTGEIAGSLEDAVEKTRQQRDEFLAGPLGPSK